MAKHYNPSITEDASRILNTKTGDNVGVEVNPIIQPVIQITRTCNIVKSTQASNTLTATIYTTPSDKDFYLTSASISMIKDVTATATRSYITAIIEGSTVAFCDIASFTTTVHNEAMSMTFPVPIKIDKGTNIVITNDTNVANIRSRGTIIGYTVETTKGV